MPEVCYGLSDFMSHLCFFVAHPNERVARVGVQWRASGVDCVKFNVEWSFLGNPGPPVFVECSQNLESWVLTKFSKSIGVVDSIEVKLLVEGYFMADGLARWGLS